MAAFEIAPIVCSIYMVLPFQLAQICGVKRKIAKKECLYEGGVACRALEAEEVPTSL